jgi:hypothetical protein
MNAGSMGSGMMARSAAATMLLVLSAVPGWSDSDTDLLRQSGMLGSWAVDCKQPSSASNPYLVFAASDSGPTRTLKMGGGSLDGTFRVHAVKIFSDDLIEMETDSAVPPSTVIVVAKSANTFHSVYSEASGGGRVFIRNGHLVEGDRAAVPTFERCPAR